MPILNYTTKVPLEKTLNEIQKTLTKAGANAFLAEYDGFGNVDTITFRVKTPDGEIYFTLPSNVKGVEAALKKEKEYRDDDHTRRVAWRILKDWIEAQMAIINAQMAELPQVFLPYAKTGNGQTLYERIKSDKFLMLEGPK